MTYETLDPEAARTRLDSGWTFLDVRTPEEFAAGHVPGAWNIPLAFLGGLGMTPNPDFVDEVMRVFGKDTQLVVGCKIGGRSARACELLVGFGFSALVNMNGGFHGRPGEDGEPGVPGWQERGFPCATEPEPGRGYPPAP